MYLLCLFQPHTVMMLTCMQVCGEAKYKRRIRSKSLRQTPPPIFFDYVARLFVLLSVLALSSLSPLPVCQMLALAVLDRILSIDRQNQWLVYVCNSGYLRSLVESLRQDDAALQSLLTPQPPLLKPLYIYESKMVRCTLKQTHCVLHCFFQ